jgi:hypothetical protein
MTRDTSPKALIFHGTLGSPQHNWFGWLQEELMMEGWQVAVPALPTPDDQSLANWTQALKDQISDLSDLELIVGHSLGATFAMRLIEGGFIKPKKLILVSAVINAINNEEYDSLNESFIKAPFNWNKIKGGCSDITLIHGSDDPYVPLKHAEECADRLGIPLLLVEKGGHLNSESRFDNFPELLDIIHA